MTATADILSDLTEDRTHQVHTSPDGQGGIRWFLMRYQRPAPEHLTGSGGPDVPLWCQIATCTTAKPTGQYRDVAFGWLRSLGHDPGEMDLVLFLDDAFERLRPASMEG